MWFLCLLIRLLFELIELIILLLVLVIQLLEVLVHFLDKTTSHRAVLLYLQLLLNLLYFLLEHLVALSILLHRQEINGCLHLRIDCGLDVVHDGLLLCWTDVLVCICALVDVVQVLPGRLDHHLDLTASLECLFDAIDADLGVEDDVLLALLDVFLLRFDLLLVCLALRCALGVCDLLLFLLGLMATASDVAA